SSFRPTYNMTVNLVRRYERDAAYRLVRSSFAQYLSEVPLTRQLDAVVGVLGRRGYLSGWRVTHSGERLAGLYHDCDLLIAEALGEGLFDGLDPASLAALVSCFIYEPRRNAPGSALPNAKVARRYSELELLAADLRRDEAAAALPQTRQLDPGFSGFAFEWSRGGDLRRVLSGRDERRSERELPLSGGDFVRNIKQLVDLLGQIGGVDAQSRTGKVARQAAESLVRGVVAASAVAPHLAASPGAAPEPEEAAGRRPAAGPGHLEPASFEVGDDPR
ncbi:MAG: hypothetical protein M0014_06670, partial [Actinomycetota bacterium]|nr:hypothetical protein [Actinomycetota bacterium]